MSNIYTYDEQLFALLQTSIIFHPCFLLIATK